MGEMARLTVTTKSPLFSYSPSGCFLFETKDNRTCRRGKESDHVNLWHEHRFTSGRVTGVRFTGEPVVRAEGQREGRAKKEPPLCEKGIILPDVRAVFLRGNVMTEVRVLGTRTGPTARVDRRPILCDQPSFGSCASTIRQQPVAEPVAELSQQLPCHSYSSPLTDGAHGSQTAVFNREHDNHQ